MPILVLFDVHRPIGPDETFSVRSLRAEEEKPAEADVLTCLRKLDHEVETLAVYDAVKAVLDKIGAFKPDVVDTRRRRARWQERHPSLRSTSPIPSELA